MTEIVRIYQLNEAPDVAIVFDEYRRYYNQKADIKGAETYLHERLSKNESIIFIAKHQEKVIGFVQLYYSFSSLSMKPLGILNDLYVMSSYRNLGIGKSLLEAARQLGQSLSWKGLILETAQDNPARRLYERNGWTLDDEYLHYAIHF
jgi:GNAT superfamily N-acetyltransferase